VRLGLRWCYCDYFLLLNRDNGIRRLGIEEARKLVSVMSRQVGVLAVCIGLLFACSSTVEPVAVAARLKGLAFLQPGVTSRLEIEARLGKPQNLYESGLVATYYLDNLDVHAKPAGRGRFHLVLLYGASGRLEKWSLVDKGF